MATEKLSKKIWVKIKAETPEKIKVSFLLTRYYEKHFDDEAMIYPEYLDLFNEKNKIDIGETKSLILHVKIVNVERKSIIVWWKFKSDLEQHYRILYNGKLPRKDLAIQLPITNPGKHEFDVVFTAEQDELFRIWGKYNNERGSD